MSFEEFAEKFAAQFESPETLTIEFETKFKELDSWDSLTAMSILAMILDDYEVEIKSEELRSLTTVGEVYELVKKGKN